MSARAGDADRADRVAEHEKGEHEVASGSTVARIDEVVGPDPLQAREEQRDRADRRHAGEAEQPPPARERQVPGPELAQRDGGHRERGRRARAHEGGEHGGGIRCATPSLTRMYAL